MSEKKVVSSTEIEPLIPLRFVDYPEYFEAIVADNATYVDALLTKAGPVEAYRLANAEFDFKDVHCPYFRKEVERGEVPITLPLHVAMTNNAMTVADMLLKHGANILALDSLRNNLLHACVITSFYDPDMEIILCKSLMTFLKRCDKSTTCQLLIQENRDGLRPVEQATQQGRLELLCAYIMSMGEHLQVRTEYHGMTKYTWYDVTEYESPRRHDRSPMVLLTYLDRSKAVEAANHILKCPFFGEWIKAKVRVNAIPMAIWAILRALLVLAYFILDRDDSYLRKAYKEMKEDGYNVSTPCFTDMATLSSSTTNVLGAFITIYAFIAVLFDIIDMAKTVVARDYIKSKDLNGWKNMIVKLYFYRICTFIVNFSCLVSACMYILYIFGGTNVIYSFTIDVLTVCRIVIPICSCWSMMYFLQALPYVGRSIVTIQGMLIDMGNFLVLWLLVMLPFIHTFNMLINNYTTAGCISDFNGLGTTMYTLFRMMLNMVDLTQYDLIQKHYIYLLHVIYVFMVAIILVNFLIAMMSESASRTAENQVIINWLNSLSIAATIQQRFGAWILKPYYDVMLPRMYTSNCSGQLCIVTRTNRREDIRHRLGKGPCRPWMEDGKVEQSNDAIPKKY